MTRDEVKKLLMEIENLYPEAFQKTNPAAVVSLWTEMLANEKYDDIHGYLLTFAMNDAKGYAPKIGQLLAFKPQPYDDRGLKDWGPWTE